VCTGIVTATARVLASTTRSSGSLLVVERPPAYGDARPGESIAVSGVCLTVLPGEERGLAFDVSPETLRRSTLGRLGRGDRVNLERALAAGDRFGGHVVSGHVDATTPVRRLARTGDFVTFTFAMEISWARYVVEKGSIALDGISLTVADLRSREFDVAVIPHTLSETTLGDRGPGDEVNVEVDVLAKYVERIVTARRGTDEDRRLERLLDTA
jgi:riboflavin synthase